MSKPDNSNEDHLQVNLSLHSTTAHLRYSIVDIASTEYGFVYDGHGSMCTPSLFVFFETDWVHVFDLP